MKKFLFFTLSVLLLLVSCSSTTPQLPSDPPLLEQSEEYLFGTPTDNMDGHAWTTIWDEAEMLYAGEFNLQARIMKADAEWQDLVAYYESALPSADGWEPETRLSGTPGQSQVFAWHNGDYVLAVVGLDSSYAQGDYIPVNIITNVPE